MASVSKHVAEVLGAANVARLRRQAGALTSLLMVITPQALAQPARTEGATLEEVVVTARFRQENLQETPLSITAVSGDMLENQGLTNVSDLGLVIPNSAMRQQSNIFGPNPTIGLRGVNTNEFIYTTEPGVAVYVDDVYHGTLTGSSMDLLDLERVEVLRGPQGTLFGKNSLGGAIRLISKAPKGDDTGSVEATYGTSNRLDVKASFDMAMTEKVFMRVSGVAKQIDGYQDRLDFTCQMIANGTPALAGTFPQQRPSNATRGGNCKIGENGGSELTAGRVMLRFVPNEDLDANLAADYSKTVAQPGADSLLKGHNPADPLHAGYNSALIAPRYGGLRYDNDRFVTGDPYTTFANFDDPIGGARWPTDQITEVWSVAGKVDYDITDRLHLKTVAAYRTYDSSWASDGDFTIFDLSTTLNLQEHEQTSVEVQLSGALFDNRLDWTTGAFYYDSTSHLGGYVTFGSLSFFNIIPNFAQNDGFTAESKSAFAHVVFDLTDSLSLTAGVRQTDETKTYTFDHTGYLTISRPLEYGDKHFDWKAGVDFKLNDDMMIYGLASTGFRSEGAQPRPFVPAQLLPVPGEEILAYEIGFKGDFFDNRLRANIAAFVNDYDPRITTRIGYQCNNPANPETGPFYPITIGTCPAGTQMAGSAGLLWINYFSAPGTARGAELELTANPIDHLTLNGSMGYYSYKSDVRNPNQDGYIHSTVREQPRLTYSLGAQYDFQFSGGSIIPRVDMFYQGERTNGDVKTRQLEPYHIIPDYTLFNGRLTYLSSDGKWNAALSVENALDKFYWITRGPERSSNGVTPIFTRSGVPARGREWAITLKRNF